MNDYKEPTTVDRRPFEAIGSAHLGAERSPQIPSEWDSIQYAVHDLQVITKGEFAKGYKARITNAGLRVAATRSWRAGWTAANREIRREYPVDPPNTMSAYRRFHESLFECKARLRIAIMLGHETTDLWREFYELIGDHMILTDIGWVPGQSSPFYPGECGIIRSEVNAPPT